MKPSFSSIGLIAVALTLLFSPTRGADWVSLNAAPEAPPVLDLTESINGLDMSFQLPGFFSSQMDIQGVPHTTISAEGMTPILKTGAPDLPKFYRSIIIPDDREMSLQVEVVSYEDISLKNLVPSKGNLTRDIDPATVPFIKGSEYALDSFYPATIASLGKAYVMRDKRGAVVQIHPFQYNPQTETLRVYTELQLTVIPAGPATQGLKSRPTTTMDPAFTPVYRNHFINYEQNSVLYDLPAETGRLLIISADAYLDELAPLIAWKQTRGLSVELIAVSEIGNTASAILETVQSIYDSPAGLTHLLLIGDAGDVAPAISSGAASDPSYALLDGGNGDQYPDIFVGRLSGSNPGHIETQVAKIIGYEANPDTEGDWYAKAIGMASAEGAGIGDDGESDIQHMNNLRADLVGYGYEPVDQIYDPSANTSMVSNAVNEGRGLINYVGHGSNTAWSTTGFSNSNVSALNNTGKLPVIFSVACVNGNFQGLTCFAEAWMQAGTATDQRGAVAFYGSTINQSWAPPMCAQDEFADLLVEDSHLTIGALMYAASAQMIDEYGTGGFEMYATWHIFGDPSMPIRTQVPATFTGISTPEVLILGATEIQVSTPDFNHATITLSKHGELLDSAPITLLGSTTLNFEALAEIDTCLLTITGLNRVPWQQEILIIAPDGPYLINQGHVVNDDTDGNGNGRLDFGETADVYLTIRNVGSEASESVNARIQLADPYVTLLSDSASSTTLAADSTLLLGPFSVFIEDDVPNGHQLSADISMDNGIEMWSASLSITCHAPDLVLAEVLVLDDQNGRLDRGESAQLALCLNNLGGAGLEQGTLQVNSSDPFVEMDVINILIQDLLAGTLDSCSFEISSQYATPPGHIVDFSWSLVGDHDYEASGIFSVPVGLIIEDFESGDFETFDWIHSGHQDWTIDESIMHEGSFSARSGTIGNSQNSEIGLTISIDEAAPIRFFFQVSSQSGSDGLEFRVDGSLINQWQGEIPWTEYSHALIAGDHELTWRYTKNYSSSAGSDCAWLDFIQLPNIQIPGSIIGDVTADTNINVQDIVRLVSIILGQGDSPADYELFCGDVNGDLVVDIGDLVLLVNFIMGDQMGRPADTGQALASLTTHGLQLQSEGAIRAIELSYTGQFTTTLPEAYHVVSNTENGLTQLVAYVLNGTHAENILKIGEPNDDFQLVALKTAGESGRVTEIDVTGLNIPTQFKIYGNFPNPFNPSTTLGFDIPKADQALVRIFDVKGREVITLMDQNMEAGHYQLVWNGNTRDGHLVEAGLYFALIQVGQDSGVQKLLMIK